MPIGFSGQTHAPAHRARANDHRGVALLSPSCVSAALKSSVYRWGTSPTSHSGQNRGYAISDARPAGAADNHNRSNANVRIRQDRCGRRSEQSVCQRLFLERRVGKDGGRDGKFGRKANCAELRKRRGRRLSGLRVKRGPPPTLPTVLQAHLSRYGKLHTAGDRCSSDRCDRPHSDSAEMFW
jgi:hypothetical protein